MKKCDKCSKICDACMEAQALQQKKPAEQVREFGVAMIALGEAFPYHSYQP